MIGTKIYKTDLSNYSKCAMWCNNNNATIVDKGDYYEVVPIVIPLEVIKSQKLAELKQARDSEEVSPLNNFDVDSKSLSRIDIASKILATGAIPNIEWTMADNSVETINSKNIGALYVALALKSNELHEKYRTLKEQVEKAKTSEEVSKVMWND